MKKYYKIIVLAVVAIVAGCILVNTHESYANPPGVTGGDADSEKTGGCSATGHYCTSYGITWVEQSYDEYMSSQNIVGMSDKQKAEMNDACAGKADCVIYRLAYVKHTAGGGTSLDIINGQLDVATAIRNGAVYIDPSTIPGGISKEKAQWLYEYALSIGVEMDDGWLNQGAFAFDKAWLEDCPPGSPCIDEKIKEKEEEEKTVVGGATPYFQSKTKIDVGDNIPEGPQESDWDGYVNVEFSTDEESVTVYFTHTLDYQPNGFSYSSPDVFTSTPLSSDPPDTTNNYTSYSITTGGGGNSQRYTISNGQETFTSSKTEQLAVGETKVICSDINYGQKYHNIKKKKHITTEAQKKGEGTPPATADVDEVSHMDWYWVNAYGAGGSGACATVTRPADPTGAPKNPNNSGMTSSDVMFAGETAYLKWELHGNTTDTRRLMERQITAHLVDAVAGRESRFFGGYPRSSSDPYNYYSGANITARHNFGEEGADLNNSADEYPGYFNIIVPDYTGYKYCHTGGYRYESWYSINGVWKHDTRTDKNYRNYWFVYPASCRTIAKKPSMAVWNGGMMTTGGVITSSSPRYNDTTMGSRVSSNPDVIYGSWTEYLAVVGGGVAGYSSGSSFARGSGDVAEPRSDPLNLSNSTMTISNAGTLGTSGVGHNYAYLTRLETYLEGQAESPGGNTLSGMSVGSTRVLSYDGNLEITGNITATTGPYSSIYQVPQAVIFVHGDLKIAGDVTQIDAWLVVDGEINTCKEFQSGSTESDAIARPSNTCTKQLVFNGPVFAESIKLNRSFGSDPLINYRTGTFGAASTRYASGEVFNMGADTYLWAYAQAGRYGSSYTEGYTRELAPRY